MKNIEISSIVDVSLTEAWKAWTTDTGVRGFLAPDSKVELKIGGAYEMYFDPSAEFGSRGTEGMKIQSYVPERFLAFDWNNPPHMSEIRNEKTWVVIEFKELDDELSEITLVHLGWGEGELWDNAFLYFQKQWLTVIERFERAMCMGDIDWECSPMAVR